MKEDSKKNTFDWIVKIVLVVVIILLLIHNCTLMKKDGYSNHPVPNGNTDIIEIKCDNNACQIKEIKSINFAQNKVSVKKGGTITLIPIIKPSELSGSKLTWKSSDPNIATVDSNGKVTGVNVGKVTITVTTPNGKTATCVVEVVKEDVSAEKLYLTVDNDTIGIGSAIQVNAIIEPANATNRDLIWTSSDTTIATVDSKGVVKGRKTGTVTITAKTKDGKLIASTVITIAENGEFEVYDDDHTPVTWNGAADLKIFKNSMYVAEGKVAPESSNTYQFVVKNGTRYNIKYDIDFIENNPYHINMKYKLKKNDTYIVDHYVSANELNVAEALLNANNNDTFYLEWKWVSSSNDTEIGMTPDASYGLKIEVKAESTNG